jgi:predicted regulator of Ras-like GTPase activity (Roadblock/LC7/MglB family)
MADDVRRWSEELAREPGSLVFLQLGEALRRQQQLDLAHKIALRGLERHPHNADAHDLLARIAVDRGDLDRARDEWNAVLRLVPGHAGAMKGLGYLSFQQGRVDDAERYLSDAAAIDEPSVAGALRTVRRASGSFAAITANGAVNPGAFTPPVSSTDPRRLFATLLVDEGQTALLLDASGLVLGGVYIDSTGTDVAQDVGAQLSGISDEVRRSTRYLDVGDWKSITFETQATVVAMAPSEDGGLLVVAASRSTPLGLLRRLLDRCAARATAWLRDGRIDGGGGGGGGAP